MSIYKRLNVYPPRDLNEVLLDIIAGYGKHNAKPRWGEIATKDSGNYIGRHRKD